MPLRQKILAIDYGTKRIGLAVSFGTIADPLTVIPNDEKALNYICQIINDYDITRVIVGLSEQEMAQKTQQFSNELKKFVSIPIEFHDETLSSATVRNKLAAQRKSQNQPIDHLAAAEFLQDWLDTTDTLPTVDKL